MLNTFSSVRQYLKFDLSRVIIDNIVFKLHYRWTFVLLLVATLLITSRQYIGEHIQCISDSVVAPVINTFCFFTPTFTVVRHMNNSALRNGAIFQPGIGPYNRNEDEIKRHAYYQWVPFVLFGQSLCFYLPHIAWKKWEGGRIKALVYGLRMVGLTKYLKHDSMRIGKLNIPSMAETEERVINIRRTMIDRMRLNQSWGAHLVFAEVLNLINLCIQIYWTNRFLGHQFLTLGIKVLRERWVDQMDALDVVFPKVTKCTFYKYGAAGSLQNHDTLCVMALNIMNEKIFTILWFWYSFLMIMTILGLLWRLLTLFFYKKVTFTKWALYWAKPGKLDESDVKSVIEKCNFSNWVFLFFLRTNLSEFLFQKVIYHLASEFPNDAIHDNDINDYRARSAVTASPGKYPQLDRLDTVDAPLLHHRAAAGATVAPTAPESSKDSATQLV
ncbi:innexin inx7 [Drosophila grimshawi]|uniref:Innexin n=1 Tax=Drosophila grimshawi TaxID=7222 RepID=B4JMT0_DROGR|nr:innexin inx7 [Drosophila grimshawi]EDV92023.1 GH24273 [Drosophila grimshawi]